MIHTGDCFRQALARVLFCEHRLSLQVGGFDEIAVNDSEPSDARTRQTFGLRRTQCATTNDDGACIQKATLSSLADAIEKYLSAITLQHKSLAFEMLDSR
jgi:hypothetical protein